MATISNRIRYHGLMLLAVLIATNSQAQNSSVKTFLVYYREYQYHAGDGVDGYSLFVNGPMTAQARGILKEKHHSTIFLSYLNMISVEVGVTPWAADVMKNHPGALLKTIGGVRDSTLPQRKRFAWGYLTPYDSSKSTRNFFLTNPASEDWRKFYLTLARNQLRADPQIGRHGLFIDNVWPFYTMFFMKSPKELQVDMNGDGVMNRKDDWAWAESIAGFSRFVKQALGDSILILGNFGTRWDDKGTGFHILTQGGFDGVMNESFAHNSLKGDSASYPTLESWKMDVNALLIADSVGKIALAQSLGNENDAQARLFSFGSFLLGSGPKSYYNYRFHEGFDTLYRFPEFDLDIGIPNESFHHLAKALIDTMGVYRRFFTKGVVYLNIGRRPYHLSLAKNEAILQLEGGVVSGGGHLLWTSPSSLVVNPYCAAIIRRSTP